MTKSVWLRLSMVGICLFTTVECKTTPGDPNDGVVVTEQAVQVVEANGSTRADDLFAGLTRRVSITVAPRSNTRLLPNGEGVQVSYWFPDHDSRTVRANLVPNSNPARFTFDLPDSKELRVCEKMIYRWSVTYDNTRLNNRGFYLGAEQTIMPTNEQVSPGQIRQAQCVQ